jgi:hypothetical protein
MGEAIDKAAQWVDAELEAKSAIAQLEQGPAAAMVRGWPRGCRVLGFRVAAGTTCFL